MRHQRGFETRFTLEKRGGLSLCTQVAPFHSTPAYKENICFPSDKFKFYAPHSEPSFYLQVSFRCFFQERQNHLTPTHSMMDCNKILWDTSLLWKSFCPVCILEIKTKTEQRTFRRSCKLSDLASNFSISYPSGFIFIIQNEEEIQLKIMFVIKLLEFPVSHTFPHTTCTVLIPLVVCDALYFKKKYC